MFEVLVDELSAMLSAPAILEDSDFILVAYSMHSDSTDHVREVSIMRKRVDPDVRAHLESFGISEAGGPVKIPAKPELGMLARICIPATWRGTVHGYLWIVDTGIDIDGDPALASDVRQVAEHAGSLLAQRNRVREEMEVLIRVLLTPTEESRAGAADDLGDVTGLAVNTPVSCVSLTPTDPAKGLARFLVSDDIAYAHLPHGEVVLVVPRAAPGDRAVIERIVRDYRRAADGDPGASDAFFGIGAIVPSLTEFRQSWRDANIAGRVCAFDRPAGGVAYWEDLGVLRLLSQRNHEAFRRDVLGRGATCLLQGSEELVATAFAFLENAGDVQRTAQQLCIHRQTLYHRIHRIEALTSLSMSSGRDRTELHLALLMDTYLGENQ
jgi:hypothetical protein